MTDKNAKTCIEEKPKQLTRLIDDVGADEFAIRGKAQKELEKLGELAEDAIQRARDSNSPEVRRRLEVEVKVWGLKRSQNYGSQHIDEKPLTVVRATVQSNGKTVFGRSRSGPDLGDGDQVQVEGYRRPVGERHNSQFDSRL